MPKRPPQSRFGENLPTYLQNKASSSQFTYFFGDSTEIRPKKWHSQRNTKLNSNFDGFGGENAQTKVQKESPRENRGRIYLPTSGIMFVTFFFHAACFLELISAAAALRVYFALEPFIWKNPVVNGRNLSYTKLYQCTKW